MTDLARQVKVLTKELAQLQQKVHLMNGKLSGLERTLEVFMDEMDERDQDSDQEEPKRGRSRSRGRTSMPRGFSPDPSGIASPRTLKKESEVSSYRALSPDSKRRFEIQD